MNLVKIDNLTFSFKRKKIFNNFSLNIEEGRFVTLAGKNSCGKTVLIKLLSANILTHNQITVYNIFINEQNKDLIDNMVSVFTIENKYYSKTVLDELLLEVDSNSRDNINKIKKYLKNFGLIKYINESPQTLNYVDRQKIFLIKAILKESKLLLLDNILCYFDSYSKKEFVDLLNKYKEKMNYTILLVTNNLEDSIYSDRLIVINDGNIILDGNPTEVYKEEKLINKIGLNIPINYDLYNKLKLYDLIEESSYDLDDMVIEICK